MKEDRLGDKVRLQHIRDALIEISTYVDDVDLKKFTDKSMIHQACIRQLEVIGEACNRLSLDLKDTNPFRNGKHEHQHDVV